MFTFFFLSHLFKDAVSIETGMINERGAVGEMGICEGENQLQCHFVLHRHHT